MRNIFDQYSQPENRLTHALAVCLHEDPVLLGQFLQWVSIDGAPKAHDLVVVEQSLPGEAPRSEEEADARGLPDFVIHDGEDWCLLVESKIQARLTGDQLDRHARTLRRRGFSRVSCVALTVAGVHVPTGVMGRSWSGLYEWLGGAGGGRMWPERLRDYLRVAEIRLTREGYLTEGTLTMFDGFKFSADNPYTYDESKRLLKLAMAALRSDARLRALGMDPEGEGRGAITGRGGSFVWDFLALLDRPAHGGFTAYPHLTLSLHTDDVEIAVTIPNGVISSVRRRLSGLGEEGLRQLNGRILAEAKPVIVHGGSVEAYALQRHYRTQRSPATTDARMLFNLETSQPSRSGLVKHQPEWLALFAALLKGTPRSNIQFGYVVRLPWTVPALRSRTALDVIARGWCSLAPLLGVIRGTSGAGAAASPARRRRGQRAPHR